LIKTLESTINIKSIILEGIKMKVIISFLLILSYNSIYGYTSIRHSLNPPVELTSFTGQLEGSYVKLFWATASEIYNSGFAVERAIQPGQWKEIGFVKGKGTTTTPQSYEFKDPLVNNAAKIYYYRLKQIDFDGTFIYIDGIEVSLNPVSAELFDNYPNPFNPATIISYQINIASQVTLKVYDVLGKEIVTLVNEEQPAGTYEVEFNAEGLPSGVYLYKLKAGNFLSVKKMLLLK
jgi:hypothetical protein